MTGTNTPPFILLSDKLSTVTHHHILTRVPVKLDLENWNYASWVYFFENLRKSFEVTKYITGSSEASTSSTTNSPTPEEPKVDNIVLSWIHMTLLDSLQAREAELRSLKLGDLSIDAYFRKIESLASMLRSLGSLVTNDDVVTFALEGLPDKYENVCCIITNREPFLDLKTARFMLNTEEMRLKSKSQALPVDSSSSSPMILLDESDNTHRPSTPQVKILRAYRTNTLAQNKSNTTGVSTVSPLAQNHVTPVAYTTVSPHVTPVAYTTIVSPPNVNYVGPAGTEPSYQPVNHVKVPPDFTYPPANHNYSPSQLPYSVVNTAQPIAQVGGIPTVHQPVSYVHQA
ncbi:hybrid signal transduction histidine kinase M [Tanacetum coccineum]